MSSVMVRNRVTQLNVIASLALGAVVVSACSLAGPASAAVSPALLLPTTRAALPLGVPPTFVLKDGRDHMATLEVSASRRTDANGVFPQSAWSRGYETRPDGGRINVRPK